MSSRTRKQPDRLTDSAQFAAEAAYADSIFRDALGDNSGSIAALEQALEAKPDYAPAMVSMGSVEYQRGRCAEGKRLFSRLLSLPAETEDLREVLALAGDFLIQSKEYADGLELHREAVRRFPQEAAFHEGVGCCAGHEGLFDEALEASQRAIDLDPEDAKYVSDLGWTLFLAGKLEEARQVLDRAVAMDPADELARENLRICQEEIGNKNEQAAR